MKRSLLFALLLCTALTVSAQKSSKLSGKARIMLAKYGQHDGLTKSKVTLKALDANTAKLRAVAEANSPEFAPVNVGGTDVVPIWIKLKDNNFNALKQIDGVTVTAEFDKMVTAVAPIHVLEKIAELKNVLKVSVTQKEQVQTAETRIATNVDDILNFSVDAQKALLDKAYDGTGVIMGIVDQGIQFDHIMFKDRIKLALVWDAASGHMVKKTGSEISGLTYIYNGLHGSHVASTAGGSNLTLNAKYYDYTTKTSITGNRTYGGMAPGTDLVLCDMGAGLSTVAYAECIKAIADYAEEVGKPFVINMSVGGLSGPHNGVSGVAHEAIAQCATGPGKAVVIATGNYANRSTPWHTANATTVSPSRTIVALTAYASYASGSYTMKNMYHDGSFGVYARTPNVDLALDLDVVDTKTNEVLFRWSNITEDVTLSCRAGDQGVAGIEYDENLAMMFSPIQDEEGYGRLYITFDKDTEGRASIDMEVSMMNTIQSTDYFTQSGNTYTGNLYFALNVHPKDLGSTIVDAFGPGADFISGGPFTYAGDGNSYSYTAGSHNCNLTDIATDLNAIAVGNWVMSNQWWSNKTTSQTTKWATTYTLNSVHPTSSFQTTDAPTGEALPFILAPGTPMIAAGNRYATGQSTADWNPTGNNSTNPLYVNSGTSMASPVVAGICALLMQADPTLSTDRLKGLLATTATQDNHTTGPEAGPNGKVNALGAMERLFQGSSAIIPSSTAVSISKTAAGTYTEQLTIRAYGLSEDIKVTLIDPAGTFAVNKTSIARSTAEAAGETLTVTYTTGEEGETTAKLLLQSKDCKDVEIILTGAYISDGTASNNYLNMNYHTTMDDAGWKNLNAGTQGRVTGYGFTPTSDGGWVTCNAYAIYTANMPATQPKLQPWNTHSGWSNTNGNYDARDVFLGSLAYNTSGSAKYIYKSSTTAGVGRLNVSGIDEYRVLHDRTSSSSPTKFEVFECTENTTNKTITPGTTAVKTVSVSTNSTNIVTTISGLDPSKIYQIKYSVYYGKIYEHAFHIASASPTVFVNDEEATHTTFNIATKTSTPTSVTFNVFSEDLKDDIAIQLIDDNNVYSIDRTSISPADAKKTTASVKGRSVKASSKGQDVTVTLDAATEGDYPALVVLTSPGMIPVTVAINGAVELDPLTGIVGVTDPNQGKEGIWYTIQGLRLKGAPTTKGVYIFNGRKILVN